MANHRTSQAEDNKQKEVTPPAPAAPKPKPKLSQEDKVKLGKALAPALKPSIKIMSDQITAAEKKPDELHSVIGEGCVPQIESLAALITDERDKIIEDNENEALALAEAAAKKKEKEKRARALAGYLTSTAMLKASFARKGAVHLIASEVFHNKHQYFLFIPLQIVVMTIAILAFVASHQESNGNVEAATILTVIAGVLGIVAGFINAIDRYLNYRSFADMHKSSASMYKKLQWAVGMSNIKHIADGADELEGDALKEIDTYKQKLQTLEESNGDLTVPLQLINVFDEVESLVKKEVEIHNDKVLKSLGSKTADGQIMPLRTSYRGHITKSRSNYGPLYVDEVKEMDILVSAYGFLVNLIMTNKGWCKSFKCRDFPYALPEPETLSAQATKKVKEEIDQITDAKFAEPTQEEYDAAQKYSQRGDGSRTPKVPGQGGAPPSADNNV